MGWKTNRKRKRATGNPQRVFHRRLGGASRLFFVAAAGKSVPRPGEDAGKETRLLKPYPFRGIATAAFGNAKGVTNVC